MKTQLLFMLTAMLLSPLATWADALSVGNTFEVDGITYKVIKTSPREVQVGTGTRNNSAIDNSTTGALTIPSSVAGTDGNSYSVISIGDYAFYSCSGLTTLN